MKKKALFVFSAIFLFAAQAFAYDLTPPSGLDLTATSSSITAQWDANDDDTEGYYVYWWESGDSTQYTKHAIALSDSALTYSYTITGLDSDTTYFVKVASYVGSTEEDSSSKSITTTSIEINVELIDAGTITVSLDTNAASIEEYVISVGTSSGLHDTHYETVSGDDPFTLSGLTNGTYYISVTVTYSSGGTGESNETVFAVDDFGTFFSQTGDIDNGCFIESASGDGLGYFQSIGFALMGLAAIIVLKSRLRILITALAMLALFGSHGFADDPVFYKNLVGIKGGVFLPSEDLQHDVYDSIIPTSLFYERMFNRFFSADVSAGYCRAKGYAVTLSDEGTGVTTDLDLIPVSMSLNVNLDVHELITVYIGAGGDYWMFDESSVNGDYTNEVGGWHGKAGVKLFTGDSEYVKKGGVLIEASYAAIDRFGKNDVDLGGWTYSLGVMYCF